MTTAHDIRTSIDRLLDRWESSATSFERETTAALENLAAAHVDEMVDLAGQMKAVIDQLASFRQAVSAGLSGMSGQGADVAADLVGQFDRAKDLFRHLFEDLAE